VITKSHTEIVLFVHLPLLVLANGVFAMSEIAVVAARKVRLQATRRRRRRRPREKGAGALELALEPPPSSRTGSFA
jgi:CBS domain containing-hemolysin-like protein